MTRTLPTLLTLALLTVASALTPALVQPASPPANHGTHSLNGAHGFTYDGFARGLGRVASSGRIDFDGAGNVAASYTTNVAGTTFTGTFFGSYTVNPDGSGTILVDLPWLGTQAHGNFVVVDHGAATYFTATDQGYSVTGRTTRM